jgi:hypothetical protein
MSLKQIITLIIWCYSLLLAIFIDHLICVFTLGSWDKYKFTNKVDDYFDKIF